MKPLLHRGRIEGDAEFFSGFIEGGSRAMPSFSARLAIAEGSAVKAQLSSGSINGLHRGRCRVLRRLNRGLIEA